MYKGNDEMIKKCRQEKYCLKIANIFNIALCLALGVYELLDDAYKYSVIESIILTVM